MVTTSQSTAGDAQGDSKELTGSESCEQSPILGDGGNAKELSGDKLTQNDALGWIIQNPLNPYKEYVIVSPEHYKEGIQYEDYLKIYKPIEVGEFETA